MPIPVAELEKAIERKNKPLDQQVVEFLSAYPSEAFSVWEIAAGISGIPLGSPVLAIITAFQESGVEQPSGTMSILTALRELEQQGRVRSGKHKAIDYYSIRTS